MRHTTYCPCQLLIVQYSVPDSNSVLSAFVIARAGVSILSDRESYINRVTLTKNADVAALNLDSECISSQFFIIRHN